MIELRQVCKTFSGPSPVHALRGVDLSIREGDYLAVTGPSGSGKSTMLNVIGVLDTPTSGSYQLDAQDVTHMSEAERCYIRATKFGFVFQSFHLLAGRDAIENVEVGMLHTGLRRRDRQKLAVQALVRVGLEHRLRSDIRVLSGGERQRVAIARAIAHEPAIVLCDEPTGNLDQESSNTVMEFFETLHAQGQTICIITHDAAVAARAAREVVVRDGCVTAIG